MATIFNSSFCQPQTIKGVPLAGAKLYFYQTGTETEITTYQDSAAGTPHANPVVADASGIFAPVYLTVSTFKTVLKTSGGTTVQTVDNIASAIQLGYVAKSAGYTVATTDRGKVIDCTATLELELPAVATAGSDFYFYVKANGGTVTVDPNGTENINGASTSLSVADGTFALIVCTGSAWHSMASATTGNASESAAGVVELATTAEAETGTDTARAVTPAGVKAAVTGQHTIWIPASAMTPNTTNGPASSSLESASNFVMTPYLAFDASTEEFAQFAVQMPKGWNEGTVIAQYIWTHPATVTNFGVVWGIEGLALANDDALDTAWGTEVVVADTGGTTSDVYISDESAVVTVAGSPAAEEYVNFRITRVVGNGSDTMAVDAYLIGVKVHYTTDAMTDD
jgi:hypothetical protein